MRVNQINISIALCTYNGATYLREQLNSIAIQSILPDEMVICDDDSSDNTIEIINEFAQSVSFPVGIFLNKKKLGVIKNFEKAINLCKGKYIAFSDQDDIWLSDKLEKALSYMYVFEKKYGEQMPILIHSDLQVVDSECNLVNKSFVSMQNMHPCQKQPLKTLLVENYVTGCATVINRSLANISLPIPDGVLMHDWWFALTAASFGKIEFIPEATILYRQHTSNSVGASKFLSFYTLKKVFDFDKKDKLLAEIIKQDIILKEYIEQQLNSRVPELLDKFIEIRFKGGVKALFKTISNGISKKNILRNVFYYFLLFRGKYVSYINNESESL